MPDKTLLRPPIKEAILEVQFNFSSPLTYKALRSFPAVNFASQESLIQMSGKVGTDEDANTFKREQIGTAFFSEDKKRSMQIRIDGFSFSFLNQYYTSWKAFQPLAFEQLQQYIGFFQPTSVKRFSLRFINEIVVPAKDQLTAFLKILPPAIGIGEITNSYLLRMEITDLRSQATGVITELISSIPDEGTVKVYLDIDVISFPEKQEPIALDALSGKFELLRDFKNDIFFNSITEQAKAFYNQSI